MPRTWTAEQREAFAKAAKERWAIRKEKKGNNASPSPELEESLAQIEAQLNPVADDVLLEKKHHRLRPAPPPSKEEVHTFSVVSLVKELDSIPLSSVSYSDCGILLNALNKCSTDVALARRQKQEQLEAGTHRAPCKTCGRMIDISKPGGFQILTERDQFHMPVNSFYCSQNCLLARNMPSHARQTPKEKRANQA